MEGIVPAKGNDRMDWESMDDVDLLGYAKWRLAALGIEGRKELQKADGGLYKALGRRRLLDEVGLPNSKEGDRSWAGMESKKLVAFANEFVSERGIGGRKELEKADYGLYKALRRRKLLDEVGLSSKLRDWAGMEREELAAFAKGFVSERGIGGRWELQRADLGIYNALKRRKLLDEVGLPNSKEGDRNWAGMESKKLVAFAKEFVSERGIGGRKELAKTDRGLYKVLWKRKLLDAVFSDAESSRHADAVDGVLDALDSFGDSK